MFASVVCLFLKIELILLDEVRCLFGVIFLLFSFSSSELSSPIVISLVLLLVLIIVSFGGLKSSSESSSSIMRFVFFVTRLRGVIEFSNCFCCSFGCCFCCCGFCVTLLVVFRVGIGHLRFKYGVSSSSSSSLTSSSTSLLIVMVSEAEFSIGAIVPLFLRIDFLRRGD
jgi:hypothetical protein